MAVITPIENLPARFAIVASCDPYNARKHYHGDKVLKWDRATPVKWIHDSKTWVIAFSSKEDAYKALRVLADTIFGDEGTRYLWFDEDSLKDRVKADAIDLECDESEVNIDWYKGEGWYAPGTDGYVPVFLVAEDKFIHDDVMDYAVEELPKEDLSIERVRTYPGNLEIEDTYGNVHSVDFDGLQGEFTREDWREEYLDRFDKEGQNEILDTLENTSDVDFFATED